MAEINHTDAEEKDAQLLNQAIADLPRLKNYLYINGHSFSQMTKHFSLHKVNDEQEDENQELTSTKLINEIKNVFSLLIPPQAENLAKDTVNNLLMSIIKVLDPGAYPFTLQKEVIQKLGDNNLMLESKKIKHFTNLNKTDQGFTITETFMHKGNIVDKMDGELVKFKFTGSPLLEGRCVHEVKIDSRGVHVRLKEKKITVAKKEKKLQKVLNTSLIKTFKEKLQKLSGTPKNNAAPKTFTFKH